MLRSSSRWRWSQGMATRIKPVENDLYDKDFYVWA